MPYFTQVINDRAWRRQKPYGLIGMGKRGSGAYDQLVRALCPMQTEETISHHQNNNAKEVGVEGGGGTASGTQLVSATQSMIQKLARRC